MEEAPGTGPTTLIVVGVEKGKEQEAAGRLTEELCVDPQVARQIVGGTPIVFLTGLTKNEVRSLTPRLQKISEAGLEFRLTQRTPNQLPRLNWPIRPTFSPGGSGAEGVAFQWENNAFVCPGCGESFLFKRMGKLALSTEAAPTHAPAASKRDAGMPKTLSGGGITDRIKAHESGKGSNPKLEAVKETAPAKEEPSGLDEMLGDAGGELDLDSALGESPAAPAEAAADLGLTDELGGGELISSMEGLDAGGAIPDMPAGEGEEKFNVFISGIKEDAKRDEAAKIIAEIRKMPLPEAKKLTSRAMIKAADAIPKSQAEELVNKLKKLKLSARMTKAGAGG